MSTNENNPWFSPIPKSTTEKLLNPTAENIGNGFGGLASFIMNPLMKLGVISENNMKNFENKVLEKNNNIPFENRDASKQGLALKALEDSVYQLDSDELQDMFSNLIASSLDNRKNSDVLPSFSSILKDLSAEDAILLKTLYRLNAVATVDLKLINPRTSAVLPCLANIILYDDGSMDYEPVSVNTLHRLGLISIHKNTLVRPNFTKSYGQFKKEDNVFYEHAKKQLDKFKMGDPSFEEIEVEEGHITMTHLGKTFGRVVISP